MVSGVKRMIRSIMGFLFKISSLMEEILVMDIDLDNYKNTEYKMKWKI